MHAGSGLPGVLINLSLRTDILIGINSFILFHVLKERNVGIPRFLRPDNLLFYLINVFSHLTRSHKIPIFNLN
jgi:hypothetical protein